MAAPGCNAEGGSPAQAIRVVDTIPTLPWPTQWDASAHFFDQHRLDYTGLSREHALECGWKLAIHSDDIPRLVEAFQEAVRRVQLFKVEVPFRRFDVEYGWFLFPGNPLCDESGNVVKWYGTNIQLEDRKRA